MSTHVTALRVHASTLPRGEYSSVEWEDGAAKLLLLAAKEIERLEQLVNALQQQRRR